MTYNEKRQTSIFSDLRCDECDVPIPFADIASDGSSLQPEDGLTITIEGGWGMWEDQTSRVKPFILCKTHCDLLESQFPNLIHSFRKQASGLGDWFDNPPTDGVE